MRSYMKFVATWRRQLTRAMRWISRGTRMSCAALASLILLTLPVLGGQLEGEDPLLEDWRWVRFTTESGLPDDAVHQVVETTDGVIWVRTPKGLAWYDNFRWHALRVPGSWERQGDLAADLDGGVLAVVDKRFYRGDERGVRAVPLSDANGPLQIAQVLPLRASDALLVVSSSGLYKLTGNRLEPFPSPHPEDSVAFGRFCSVETGSLWYVSNRPGQGTLKWDGARWAEQLPLNTMGVFSNEHESLIAVNHDTTVNGVWSWPNVDGANPTRLPGQDGSSIASAMSIGPRDECIITYRSGRVFTRRSGEWSWLTAVPLELRNAHALLYQENGDLWVANKQGLSLHRASSTRWLSRSTDELAVQEVNAILPTPSGDLWLGTADGLYIRRADGGVERIDSLLGTRLGTVTGLLQDGQGAVWVSSGADFQGAFRFADGRWTHYGSEEGLHAQRVHRIVEDRSGRLWFLGLSQNIGVDEPGAYVFDGDTFTRWGVPEGLPNGRVFAFAEDDDGALWFGTHGFLSRWRAGAWKHWSSDNCRFFSLAVQGGRTWFAPLSCLSGLGYVDEQDELRFLTGTDGLVNDRVWELQAGVDGALWIGTTNGVSRYKDGRFSNFSRESGLLHPRVWPLYVGEDRIYIGTIGGGAYVLGLGEVNSPAPIVELASPFLDKDQALFRWRVFSYRSSPAEIETRFRIDGGAWSSWSMQRETGAIGLLSGAHDFEVQAKSMFGRLNARPARAMVEVPVPLHRHPLVLAAGMLWLATMIGVGFTHMRRKRKHLESMRASERRLRTLVCEIPICIHELDIAGRVTSMNPAGLQMLGLDCEEEVLGEDYLDLVAEEDRERVRGCLGLARKGQTTRFTFHAFDTHGGRRVFVTSITPLRNTQGDIAKMMGHTQDITDEQQAEKERRRLEKQLRQAQKMEAIGQLAGGVAHDFNNILTVIGGHAEFIRAAQKTSRPIRDSVTQIESATERAASLTHQLLAFSRRQVLQPAVLNVAEMIAEVDRMLRRLINEDIELELEAHQEVGCVKVDRVQFGQVIINLVVNARDAIEGHGKIRVAAFDRILGEQLEVGATVVPAGHYVVLEVEDTGRGIDAATQSRIFEPFFTTKDLEQGTGLGLSTVFGIVTQSAGYVLVESAKGQGARFSVYLPRIAQKEEVPAPSETRKDDLSGTETVLVAEDDQGIRNLIRHTLERHGYTVLCAPDGAQAVRIAEQHPEPIDLLLTDLVMPFLNGGEVSRRFAVARPQAGIIFLSGYADKTILSQIDDPAASLLEKPFKFSRLLALVRSNLPEGTAPQTLRPVEPPPPAPDSSAPGSKHEESDLVF